MACLRAGDGRTMPLIMQENRTEGSSDWAGTPAGAPGAANSQGRLVLVVDDQQSVLDALAMLLECNGYQIISATGGAEAVRICKSRPGEIAVVVTDMMMPEMNGTATIRALREVNPQLKFIGISGVVDPLKIHEFVSLGLVALLKKPFGSEELISALEKAFA
jgi:two-component system, cell cycle sensor histidine kinase and response regulator CckA